MDLEPGVGLLNAMDELKEIYEKSRTYFPLMRNDILGHKVTASGFFDDYGVIVVFPKGITEKDLKQHNHIADWINQNFIIRLCAMIQSHLKLNKIADIKNYLDVK